MLALPGSAYLYQGEELGLEQVEVDPEHRQDPAWFRTGEVGRDGCRVPVPWGGAKPPYDFGPGDGQPWIPQPDDWEDLTVEAQLADDSTRRWRSTDAPWPPGARTPTRPATPYASWTRRPTCSGFERGQLRVYLNCGAEPVPLPDGEVLVGQRSGRRRAAAGRHGRLAGPGVRRQRPNEVL